jgi:hypothetical protein
MSLLNKYSTPAERQRKCSFAERFDGPAEVARNGGVPTGSVTWVNNGLQLNTTTSYVEYSTRSANANQPWTVYGGVVEFTPTFAPDDGLSHYLVSTSANSYGVYKHSASSLRVLVGGTQVISAAIAEYSAYWKINEVNRLAWACINASSYLYLNGTLIKFSNTAWTAAAITSFTIGASANSFVGIIHSVKIFTSASTAQNLTTRDLEVLSAGTTYTYWQSATCIMDGMAANYDIANYRHLDLSGNGNHVLLGNGAGTGTPTKLSTQGYNFVSASSQYMSVPLAAWPGTAGTLLLDVSVSTNAAAHSLFGTDHTSGGNFEVFSSVSGANDRIIMGNGTGQTACNLGADFRWNKIIVGTTWLTSSTVKGYTQGAFVASSNIGATTPYTPTTSWWLGRYDSSYLTGTLRSFLSFSRELSSIQIADATLQMQKWRNKI